MLIGHRWRELRQQAKVSLEDMAKRTGLPPPYIPNLENGHIVPSRETFGKFAFALHVPIDWLFYDGENPPELLKLPKRNAASRIGSHSAVKDARWFAKLQRLLDRTNESGGKLVPSAMIRKMVTAQGRLKG